MVAHLCVLTGGASYIVHRFLKKSKYALHDYYEKSCYLIELSSFEQFDEIDFMQRHLCRTQLNIFSPSSALF